MEIQTADPGCQARGLDPGPTDSEAAWESVIFVLPCSRSPSASPFIYDSTRLRVRHLPKDPCNPALIMKHGLELCCKGSSVKLII